MCMVKVFQMSRLMSRYCCRHCCQPIWLPRNTKCFYADREISTWIIRKDDFRAACHSLKQWHPWAVCEAQSHWFWCSVTNLQTPYSNLVNHSGRFFLISLWAFETLLDSCIMTSLGVKRCPDMYVYIWLCGPWAVYNESLHRGACELCLPPRLSPGTFQHAGSDSTSAERRPEPESGQGKHN